ncbi:hypothetical protein FKM82_008581 [Ascaphus truei]
MLTASVLIKVFVIYDEFTCLCIVFPNGCCSLFLLINGNYVYILFIRIQCQTANGLFTTISLHNNVSLLEVQSHFATDIEVAIKCNCLYSYSNFII